MSRSNRFGLATLSLGVAAFVSLTAQSARAGNFDEAGVFTADPDATFFEDFDDDTGHYKPADVEEQCPMDHYEVTAVPDALSGGNVVRFKGANNQCPERFLTSVPAVEGSYRATIWIRHGSAQGRLLVHYVDPTTGEQLRPDVTARFAPTGRATSDGWVELATNDFPVDGALQPKVYLRISDLADDVDGIDVDAFELVPHGDFVGNVACEGARDPVCGEGECIGGRCRIGQVLVPPLPEGQLKSDMVDTLEAQLQTFFGGKKTRLVDMPLALETMEKMRSATTAWQFWNGWATAIHQLHDWHTNSNGAISEEVPDQRLNVCFIEGDADLSRQVVPSDPQYRDILVSHTGTNDTAGLHAGDRLVAIDGLHPIAWARTLADVNWSWHVASDAESFADLAEELGGFDETILKFAKTMTVIRCNGATCDGPLEDIDVASLGFRGGDDTIACDNRPFYHLDANGPAPANHYVFGSFFQGPISGTTPSEAIYGMVFDTLDGGGDPSSDVNTAILGAVDFWKANARGVILDHRAGNGGTLDAATNVTTLVRPPETVAVVRMPIESAGYTGPADQTEGVALFERAKSLDPYDVGSATYAPDLPVALIIHRDGSASDYMPYGMKGAPHVKIFGPGPTAGAFSTFIQFAYWGGLSYQFASGDTISAAGDSLMGHAVTPDVVVQQKQSDLVNGVDTIHEAALAWVRSELQ